MTISVTSIFLSVSALGQEIPFTSKMDSILSNYMIIEGDILVTKNFFENKACYTTHFWPDGMVPYKFDENVTQIQKDSMYMAMEEWEAVANVNFVPWNNEDYCIYIFDTQYTDCSNFSEIGWTSFLQNIGICDWDHRFIMVHELGHTLGFWHEHSRSDRDSYIQVNEDCIKESALPNFEIHDDGGYYGYYDFMSIMHYGANDYYDNSDPNCTEPYSITVLPPYQYYQLKIGQRDSLTYLDRTTMSFLYPEYGWKFVIFDTSPPGPGEFGTFFYPFKEDNIYSVVYDNLSEGEVLWIQPGNYLGTGVYNKQVTLRAPLGNVTIGN